MCSALSSKVLVVDDEVHIVELARLYLTREGYEVEGVGDGTQALARFAQIKPDLVILDIMLPGTDGLTICKEIRKQSQVPIIMLTARDEVTDTVVGLEVGADDYLTKPFHPQELVARAKALLRRSRVEPDQPKLIRAGKLEVDLERHEVRLGQARVQLRPKEFDLLALLARHPGRVFQRSELLDLVWGYDFPGYTRTVDVHVQQVREKLAAARISDPSIQTVWGVGYRLGAGAPKNAGAATCRLDDPIDYEARLNLLASQLGTSRLLLLNRQGRVVFDSGSADTSGQAISVTPSKRVTGVAEARTILGGQTYLVAATTITPTRDPLGAAYVVLGLPQGAFAAAAASDLVPRLLLAGGAALLLAILLVLLVSRSLSRPLGKLAAAAEDIAAGHYSRRVGIHGTDEIGKLGAAFDRMAEAVERARRVQRERSGERRVGK